MQTLEPLSANVRTPPGFTSTLIFSRDNPSCTVISELVPPMRPGYVSYDMTGYDDTKSGGASLPTARPLYSVHTNRTLDRTKARGGVNTVTEIRTCCPLGGEGEMVAGTGHLDQNGKVNKKRKDQNEDDDEDQDENGNDNDDPSAQKKPRVVWSVELHRKFVSAVNQLGIDSRFLNSLKFFCNITMWQSLDVTFQFKFF